MTVDRTTGENAAATVGRGTAAPRWLLLVHQLPSHPSNLRVRTWRRLQQLGAIPVKQAVYLLPDSPGAREDFEWLKAEIEGAGGQASVFAADSIDAWSDDALVSEFQKARQHGYDQLSGDVERAIKRGARGSRKRGGRTTNPAKELDIFRNRLVALQKIDFFGSAGRDRAAALIEQLAAKRTSDARSRQPAVAHGTIPDGFQGRLWVTRPRPGVDRMASAWLIRRFIDSDARFGFATDRTVAPRDAVPFDMFGVQFTHQGEHCTFETLVDTFAVAKPAVSRIAAVVHDLDLKDDRFGAPEAAAIGVLIDGLQGEYQDDDRLLEQGIKLFESLYRGFERSLHFAGVRADRATRRSPASAEKPR